jgi:hypothetical protein
VCLKRFTASLGVVADREQVRGFRTPLGGADRLAVCQTEY